MPPYLFLQMDNCYRECKNRYILGFCSLLVEKGIFKEVGRPLSLITSSKQSSFQIMSFSIPSIISCAESFNYLFFSFFVVFSSWQVRLSFLMVGHTHEDVDQVLNVNHVKFNFAIHIVYLVKKFRKRTQKGPSTFLNQIDTEILNAITYSESFKVPMVKRV